MRLVIVLLTPPRNKIHITDIDRKPGALGDYYPTSSNFILKSTKARLCVPLRISVRIHVTRTVPCIRIDIYILTTYRGE